MASAAKEVATEILPFIRVYKDGSVDRLVESPTIPPSPHDPETGVSSKDISISLSPPISARLFLPPNPHHYHHHHHKLPVLVYFHGGGFCFQSAFSAKNHRFLNSLVSQAKVLAVSVEYRLAPENPLPIAYEDCWFALQWVASHRDHDDHDQNMIREPWLSHHGDFERVFLGGESAGANIVHNIAMRAGKEALRNGVCILGAFLTHPYFWGSDQRSSSDQPNSANHDYDHDRRLGEHVPRLMWNFVYPTAPGGVDNPMINPAGPEAPSLAGLGCRRLLVSVSEKDLLRERGKSYCEAVRRSGWRGEVELVDVEGEGHAFQILRGETENAKILIRRLADFLISS